MTADRACRLIRGARIFDGDRLRAAASVLLAGGTIAGIGAAPGVPAGAEVVDGRGHTLLPGLIDCHVHASDVRALGQALAFGVTTELDMFTGPDLAAQGPPAPGRFTEPVLRHGRPRGQLGRRRGAASVP